MIQALSMEVRSTTNESYLEHSLCRSCRKSRPTFESDDAASDLRSECRDGFRFGAPSLDVVLFRIDGKNRYQFDKHLVTGLGLVRYGNHVRCQNP